MNIVAIDKLNVQILLNLAQAYEAEFSIITNKKPGPDGLYPLDTQLDDQHPGYIIFDKTTPVGFCIKGICDGIHDISEFYIIPTYRIKGFGRRFAIEIFKMYSGKWQVRQIEGAIEATLFWRATIRTFTNDNFTELIDNDGYWGKVTKQLFTST